MRVTVFAKNGNFENLCLHFWILISVQKDLSNHKSPRSFKTLILKLSLYSITSLLYQSYTQATLAVVEFWKCMVCLDKLINQTINFCFSLCTMSVEISRMLFYQQKMFVDAGSDFGPWFSNHDIFVRILNLFAKRQSKVENIPFLLR